MLKGNPGTGNRMKWIASFIFLLHAVFAMLFLNSPYYFFAGIYLAASCFFIIFNDNDLKFFCVFVKTLPVRAARRFSPKKKIVCRLSRFTWDMNDFCRGWSITGRTGSGKTAVLMMSPYLLQATRVLVITPTRRRHRPRDVLGRLGRRHASSPHRRVYFGRAKDGS